MLNVMNNGWFYSEDMVQPMQNPCVWFPLIDMLYRYDDIRGNDTMFRQIWLYAYDYPGHANDFKERFVHSILCRM